MVRISCCDFLHSVLFSCVGCLSCLFFSFFFVAFRLRFFLFYSVPQFMFVDMIGLMGSESDPVRVSFIRSRVWV